jgi:hypothetical protein
MNLLRLLLLSATVLSNSLFAQDPKVPYPVLKGALPLIHKEKILVLNAEGKYEEQIKYHVFYMICGEYKNYEKPTTKPTTIPTK